MKPFLFHIGTLGVPAFFFMIMIGSLAGTFYAYHRAKRERGIDPVVMLDFGIIAIIASVIGSRIVHILVENPSYYWEDPIRVFYFWQGGFVSLGAIIFSFIGLLIYLRIRKLPPWRYMDLIMLGVPITMFFVRLGCLCAGCCYGKPTDFFLHLTFTDPAGAAGALHPGTPLLPSQPLFMLNTIVMFFVLQLAYRYRHYYGQVLATFFLYYGVSRFFVEFTRGDEDRGLWFNHTLSSGQIAMVLFFLTGLVLHFVLRHRQAIPKD